MSIRVSSAFCGGNIEVVDASRPDDVQLRIVKDVGGRFMQWFYFRVSNCRDLELRLRLVNASEAAYSKGYEGYSAVASTDREEWLRVPTSYDGHELEIRLRPDADAIYVAYFAPYSLERHADLVARCQRHPDVRLEVLGATLDGRDVDLLRVGHGPIPVWTIARQHPGETMAEHWMEGFLERLLDDADPIARELRERATFHVVPNMNPDGSARGHLRTNAAGTNLNRAWLEPSMEQSPEVFLVRERMRATSVDLCLDIHGDEELPCNFAVGPDGIPSLRAHQMELFGAFRDSLARRSADFQTERGYPPAAPGQANLRLCTNWVAETFGCLALTLEQPFKDASDHPDPRTGWSPARCRALAHGCVDVVHELLGRLRP